MWETVIVHDFIQEEQKLQFNSQVKVVISRAEGTDCKPETGDGSGVRGQGYKMMTSEVKPGSITNETSGVQK